MIPKTCGPNQTFIHDRFNDAMPLVLWCIVVLIKVIEVPFQRDKP